MHLDLRAVRLLKQSFNVATRLKFNRPLHVSQKPTQKRFFLNSGLDCAEKALKSLLKANKRETKHAAVYCLKLLLLAF